MIRRRRWSLTGRTYVVTGAGSRGIGAAGRGGRAVARGRAVRHLLLPIIIIIIIRRTRTSNRCIVIIVILPYHYCDVDYSARDTKKLLKATTASTFPKDCELC
jgi:hypothetical protein